MVRAIILAAGEGTRLRPHTLDRPKCLVELAGRPLLSHQLEVLAAAGVDDVTVVTGYRADQIERMPNVQRTAHNPAFDRTNMVSSMMCARDRMDGSDHVLVLYADIVYEPRVLTALLHCDEPFATSVNLDWFALWRRRMDDPLADAETLKLDAHGHIVELGKKPRSLDDVHGQYMGLIRFDASFCREVLAFYDGLDPDARYDGKDLPNMYMTSLLQGLVDAGHPLSAVCVHGGWIEVDSVEDLALYEGLAAEGKLSDFWSPPTPDDATGGGGT